MEEVLTPKNVDDGIRSDLDTNLLYSTNNVKELQPEDLLDHLSVLRMIGRNIRRWNLEVNEERRGAAEGRTETVL